MGSKINMIGKKYGKLLVIKESQIKTTQNKLCYECQCDCGNMTIVSGLNLRTGKTKSCGCINESKKVKMDDLIGQHFGQLTVLNIFDKTKYLYECQCSCGTITYVNRYNLLYGYSKNCGCTRKETISKIMNKDTTGMRFGKLTVIEKVGLNKFGKTLYRCHCDCGNDKIVSNSLLLNGHTQSCGCISSWANEKIACLLSKWQVNFKREYRFDNCRHIFLLPFDFYLSDNNLCIEYDGEFHYLISTRNPKEKLLLQQKRDKIKTNYCQTHHIDLLRIPYWGKGNIEKILKTKILINRERLSEKAAFSNINNKG